MANIAIIYYSATGHTYQIAKAYEEGATAAGADVRLRKVRELAPDEAVASNQGWYQHRLETQHVPEATMDDLDWADGYAFGTPTRYGNVSAQLKQFLDTTGGLWLQGKLANKVATGFTGAGNAHGGQETTLTTLYNVMCHWGAIVVPSGYTNQLLFAAGGNPYGVSYTDPGANPIPAEILTAARYMGQRLTRAAELIAAGRDRLVIEMTAAR